jgi:hypothetical protein
VSFLEIQSPTAWYIHVAERNLTNHILGILIVFVFFFSLFFFFFRAAVRRLGDSRLERSLVCCSLVVPVIDTEHATGRCRLSCDNMTPTVNKSSDWIMDDVSGVAQASFALGHSPLSIQQARTQSYGA